MPQLQCEEIRFPSADGVHTVAASMYTMPGVPVRAVLQLSHGMCEYVQRYRPMAQWYAQRGIALAGNDHLGHGGTANKGEHGHYGEPRGRYHLLNDLHTMNGIIHQKFPGVPVFLYGHSMGSFYARWYAETWPESISGGYFQRHGGSAHPQPGGLGGCRADRSCARAKICFQNAGQAEYGGLLQPHSGCCFAQCLDQP